MEQSQKFTFALKRSRFVASPPNYDLPWHRITLEPRMSYPALRVTRINFHLKISVFFSFSLKFSMKFIENQIFSNFSIFSKNVQNFVRTFDPAIIYRPRRYLAQNHRWNLLYPEIKSDRNLNVWSRVKNSIVYNNSINMSQVLRINICLTPYYSLS